jgi:hypothetical protein
LSFMFDFIRQNNYIVNYGYKDKKETRTTR